MFLVWDRRLPSFVETHRTCIYIQEFKVSKDSKHLELNYREVCRLLYIIMLNTLDFYI